MTIEDVIRRIGEIGIVPVVRAATAEDATRAVEAYVPVEFQFSK